MRRARIAVNSWWGVLVDTVADLRQAVRDGKAVLAELEAEKAHQEPTGAFTTDEGGRSRTSDW